MFLCLESICILVGKAGRYFRDAILPSWNPCNWWNSNNDHGPGLLGLPISIESWECDLCEKIGKGDANSFFALEEIDHFLESQCRGSLRRHVVADDSPMESATGRTVVVGLGSTWVEAGQTMFINAGTRESFQVQQLIVPSSVAAHFMIEGISIGSHPILESRCPAILFTEAYQCLCWKSDVICSGLFTVAVTNMSEKGTSFQGALVGTAITAEQIESGIPAAHAMLSGTARIADQELTSMLAETEP
jgi:hypothetical protein